MDLKKNNEVISERALSESSNRSGWGTLVAGLAAEESHWRDDGRKDAGRSSANETWLSAEEQLDRRLTMKKWNVGSFYQDFCNQEVIKPKLSEECMTLKACFSCVLTDFWITCLTCVCPTTKPFPRHRSWSASVFLHQRTKIFLLKHELSRSRYVCAGNFYL